jgi:hypothetical protein
MQHTLIYLLNLHPFVGAATRCHPTTQTPPTFAIGSHQGTPSLYVGLIHAMLYEAGLLIFIVCHQIGAQENGALLRPTLGLRTDSEAST